MFNLAIDSMLRGCDVVALKVEDIASRGYAVERTTVRHKKTGVPVRFEVTEQTRQAVDDGNLRANRRVTLPGGADPLCPPDCGPARASSI
jgi:integrase